MTHLSAPVNRFSQPQRPDAIWTAQNYHDHQDSFMGPADIKLVDEAFFNPLKPGGMLMMVDYTAAADSGLRDAESLHRIDPGSVRHEVEAAGFVFEAEMNPLKNRNDDHAVD